MERSSPAILFSKVDLPTLGFPTIATLISPSGNGVSATVLRKCLHHFVQEIANVQAMLGRDEKHVVDSQFVELLGIVPEFRTVAFVHDQEQWLGGLNQELRKFLIQSCNTRSAVNNKQDARPLSEWLFLPD